MSHPAAPPLTLSQFEVGWESAGSAFLASEDGSPVHRREAEESTDAQIPVELERRHGISSRLEVGKECIV